MISSFKNVWRVLLFFQLLHIRELSSCWRCASFTHVLGAPRVEVEGHFCHQSSVVSPLNPNFLRLFQFVSPSSIHTLYVNLVEFISATRKPFFFFFDRNLRTHKLFLILHTFKHNHLWSVPWISNHTYFWALTVEKAHCGIFQIK